MEKLDGIHNGFGGGGRGRRVIEVTGERRTPPPTPPVSRARRLACVGEYTMPSVCLTRGQDARRMRTRGSGQCRS